MPPDAPSINDCWNKIGVWGKADCPELVKHGHCRNCPVYSTAATQLLNGTPPPRYLEEWTKLIAKERPVQESDVQSAVIFCLGSEWLALSTKVFKEIADVRTIHTLPHRRKGVVLGIVNIRGELLICVSLARALGLEKSAEVQREKNRIGYHRFLVINEEGKRLVFPVDEIGGIHHFSLKEVKDVPSTIGGAVATHTIGVLSWKDRTVGRLDEQLLFYTLNKGLA